MTVARPARTAPSPTAAHPGAAKVITHAAGAEGCGSGARGRASRPLPGPRGGSPAAARRRAPRSYLGGRESGGGGRRRAAGTRLLLLGRVVQQNFAALVELPHGGRGGGGSRLPSSWQRREGRGGTGRCLRGPGRGELGSARHGSARLSPRRGLPGREGGALPGGAGSPPPRDRLAGRPACRRPRPAQPRPRPRRRRRPAWRLRGAGREEGPARGSGRAGGGDACLAAPLLTCRRSPPGPPPAAAAPPLPCLRGRGHGEGGAGGRLSRHHGNRRGAGRALTAPGPLGRVRGAGAGVGPPAGRLAAAPASPSGEGGKTPPRGLPLARQGAPGDKAAPRAAAGPSEEGAGGRCGGWGWRCPGSGHSKMSVQRSGAGHLRWGRTCPWRAHPCARRGTHRPPAQPGRTSGRAGAPARATAGTARLLPLPALVLPPSPAGRAEKPGASRLESSPSQ